MSRQLRLSAGVFLILSPILAISIALMQGERSLNSESERLTAERAAGAASRTRLTLDGMFEKADALTASAGQEQVDLSILGTSHPSISSVAVFDKNGFQIDRWPQGSVSRMDPPQAPGVTNIPPGRLLRTSQTPDGRTIAIAVSLDKLQEAMGLDGTVDLRDRSSALRSEEPLRPVAGYPLVATAEEVSRPRILSPGWIALVLLGVAAYLLVVRSILARRRSRENSLAQRNLELESELKQIQSSFLSSVADELLRPLSHVLGLIGTLAGRWEDLSDEKRRLLVDRIGANAEAMDEMVEEMRDFARIEEGTHRLLPRVCSLQMECQAVLDKLKPTLRAHRVVSMVPEDLSVVADSRALRRVLEILLCNAVRFSPKDSLIILRAHRSGDEVVTSVDDESASIPSEDVNRVFDRFYKRGDERSGPGVGLWIAKDFVSSMHGQIHLETSDRGNTLTFRLPAVLSPNVTLTPHDVLVSRQLP